MDGQTLRVKIMILTLGRPGGSIEKLPHVTGFPFQGLTNKMHGQNQFQAKEIKFQKLIISLFSRNKEKQDMRH